jgi:peptide/nickel transport system permease protein
MSTIAPAASLPPAVTAAEEKVAVATQLQLTWWRFRRHKVAVASGVIVLFFYLVAVFADFLATTDPYSTLAARSYIPPQSIHWFDDDGSFRPHVFALEGKRDMRTFRLVYVPNP